MFDRRPPAGFLAGTLLPMLLVAACSAPPRPAGETDAAGPPAAGPSTVSHRVVASDVTVRVYRDGPLAELGHNHVIATTAVSGWIDLREPLESSTFSLSLPLDGLVVDDAARRAAAGPDFPDNLTAADKDGTRRNLLGPALLDAARHPVLRLDSVAIEAAGDGYRVLARTEVAGVERQLRLPARMAQRDGQVVVSGEFVLTHADLGLTPFSAALGALRVREDMEVAYRLVASREPS
jgi:polyisoprenoid-binding protein YceI